MAIDVEMKKDTAIHQTMDPIKYTSVGVPSKVAAEKELNAKLLMILMTDDCCSYLAVKDIVIGKRVILFPIR